MSENIKVVQLRDPITKQPIAPIVNVQSIRTNDGKDADGLVAYTIAGTDVPIPELKDLDVGSVGGKTVEDIKTEISNDVNTRVGQPGGIAGLDGAAKVPSTQLPDNIVNHDTSLIPHTNYIEQKVLPADLCADLGIAPGSDPKDAIRALLDMVKTRASGSTTFEKLMMGGLR